MVLTAEDLAALREALTPPGGAPISEEDLAVITALLCDVAILCGARDDIRPSTAPLAAIRKRG